MLVRCVVVLVYFTLLFLATRVLEFAGMLDRRMRCSEKCTDMQMLTTKQLQKVLDHRGISYRHAIEKTDLISLVDSSGELSVGELLVVDNSPTDDDVLHNLRYFRSADEFLSSYTYPSVWLLQPLFIDSDVSIDWTLSGHWLSFLRVVQSLDIFTGQLNCTASYNYCSEYSWSHGRTVLVSPYDTTFMSYESMPHGRHVSPADTFNWLTARLLLHIHNITSLTELRRDWLDVSRNSQRDWPTQDTRPINVVVARNDSAHIPVFLAVLSVVMGGRVRVAEAARSIVSEALTLPDQQLTLIISTSDETYVYGGGDADCMTLSAVRLLLTMLAPGAGDLLDLAITLSLLLICVQPCIAPSSSLRCRLSSTWSLCLQLSAVFLLYCFFVSYVIPEQELHSLHDGLLPVCRSLTLTSFGDLVRSDWLRYTTVNFGGFVTTYFLYLLLVGWLCGRQRKAWLTCMWDGEMDEDTDWFELTDYYTAAVTDSLQLADAVP